MKLNIYTVLRTILLAVLAIVLFVGSAPAQEYPLRPPLLPSGKVAGPPISYFAGGAKWRNIQTLRFELKPHAVWESAGVNGWIGYENTHSFTEKIVAPYIEYGTLRTRYFGLVLGLSGFTLGETDVFLNTGGLTVPVGTSVEETLSNRIDLTMVEFTLAGRSRYPMYGLGDLGVSFGALFAPSPFRIVTRSRVVSTGGGLAAGTVVQDIAVKTDDTWFNFGLTGAVDVEIGVNRFFVKGIVEWDWYFLNSAHKGTIVETHYNPTGVGLSLVGGVRF
jgi:hypothetical protein